MKTINFMGQRHLAAAFSAILLALAIGSLTFKQLNWGLDFTGGTLVEVHYSDVAPLQEIRGILEGGGFQRSIVVSFGSDQDVLIRLPQGLRPRATTKEITAAVCINLISIPYPSYPG